jgi:hypothetical protein
MCSESSTGNNSKLKHSLTASYQIFSMKYFNFLTIGILLFLSCTKTVILDFEIVPKLTFNCILNPDSLIKANLSESRSMSTAGEFLNIEGANIKLYENEIFLGNMIDLGNGNYFFNYHPKSGQHYKVTINKDGFPEAIASTIVPFLSKVEFSKRLVNKEQMRYQISVGIHDSINKNYYWYSSYRIDKESGQKVTGNLYSIKTSICIDNFNKVIEPEAEYGYWYEYLLRITDVNNNGGLLKFETDFWSRKQYEGYEQILIVDEHYDSYLKTSIQMRLLENQVIALNEPVQIHSNVDNGYGIFGANVVSLYKVE